MLAARRELRPAPGPAAAPAAAARGRGRPHRPVCGSAAREQKDPAQFASMDEARAYLRRQAGSGGPISGLLNWLSESAFGWSKVRA
jgi:hypothetical protein